METSNEVKPRRIDLTQYVVFVPEKGQYLAQFILKGSPGSKPFCTFTPHVHLAEQFPDIETIEKAHEFVCTQYSFQPQQVHVRVIPAITREKVLPKVKHLEQSYTEEDPGYAVWNPPTTTIADIDVMDCYADVSE